MTKEEEDKSNVLEEVKELREKIKKLQDRTTDNEKKKTRVTAQTDLLEKYSKGLFDAGQKANTSDLLDVKTIGKEGSCV